MRARQLLLVSALLGMLAGASFAQSDARPAPAAAPVERTAESNAQTESTKPGAAQRMYRSSKIVGTAVRDLQGRRTGEIHDLVLGSRRGEIAYAVVSFGGVMGVGKTFHAVPWQALQPREGGRFYVLNADRTTIRNAPGFDMARWPDLADQRWRDDIDDYWRRTVGQAISADNELTSAPSGASVSSGSATEGAASEPTPEQGVAQ